MLVHISKINGIRKKKFVPKKKFNLVIVKGVLIHVNPKDLSKYVLNILQEQGSATIRTEEALLGTLAILNLAKIIHNQVAF